MPSHYDKDPVLLKLSAGTVTALYNAHIKCLEDLFTLSEDEIYDITGIGKKRGLEIIQMLHALPFDYMDDSLPGNPEQDPYAGVDTNLARLLSESFYYNDNSPDRGLKYYQNRQVGQIKMVDEATREYLITVNGSRPYTVQLQLEAGQDTQFHCTCPAFSQWYGAACKHVYAAALALAEQQRLMRFEADTSGDYAYRQMLQSLKSAKSDLALKASHELEYMLVREQGEWNLYPKQIYPLLKASQNNSSRYGTYHWRDPWQDLSPSNATDRMIVSYLKRMEESNNYYGYGSNKNNISHSIGDVLDLLTDRTVYLKEGSERASKLRFQEDPFRLSMRIRRGTGRDSEDAEVHGDLSIELLLYSEEIDRHLDNVDIISLDPCWVRYGATLARVESTDLARKFFLNAPRNSIQLPSNDIESFLQEFYPMLLEADVEVDLSEDLIEPKEIDPIPRLYLSETGQQLKVEFRAAYGDYEIQHEFRRDEILLPARSDENGSGPLLWSVTRQIEQEQSWLKKVKQTGLKSTGYFHTFTPEESPLEWIVEQLPKLTEAGFEVFGEKGLKRYAPPKKMTSSSFRVNSGEQWFELEGTMSFGDVTIGMHQIRQVLINDKSYVRLQDNSTGELSETWLRQMKKLLKLMESGDDRIRVPKIAAPVVKELGETADEYQTDEQFEQYAKRLQEFEDIEQVDPPEQFGGELRPYQQAGLSWMYFLHQYGFGGILADDMGLGKTVQVLALLRKVEETGSRPRSLVIAPRSVLHNWQAEAKRFIPDYEVYIHHGSDRAESRESWPEADISITTYSTMRNDVDLINEQKFDYVVLDESHTIRNPASKTFRALLKIRGTHRLCLSGTPVQNTTMDLWSQFEFINPGLLGGQKKFREMWVKPLEERNDKEVEQMLHKMVEPFILRRTKQQVARDLPPLTSSLVECEMDESQQKVYEKYRQTYQKLVNDEIEEKGLQKSRFVVLEGLTRLRQICCSPTLLENEKGHSAKLQRFTERVEELIREGHRALVFSQFVTFLKQIEAEIKSRGWNYEYLDGQTTDRQERVKRFQSDSSKQLFLISLKAGGEGLNLTAADYVFLMDPWWNPAAERQAMDRTHRIGQNDHVFVYRFVCPGTVEEKILRLQEKKRDLAEKLIVAESGIFKQLNRDDLMALFE